MPGTEPRHFVDILDGPGLILPNPPPRRPEVISIGLFNRSSFPSETSPYPGWEDLIIPVNYVKGYVLNVNHSALQPNALDEDFVSTVVDDAVVEAREGGLQLKVRVFFGANAADWLKAYNGGPMTLNEPQSGGVMTTDVFWKAEAVAAKVAFWAQFAERYNQYMGIDGPITEVACSSAMTKFAEEDIRQSSDAANRATYTSFGYTIAEDLAACRASIDSMFPLRCVTARACNPHQVADKRANVAGTTITLMKYARTQLGLYASVGNNSDRVAEGWPTANLSLIYGAMTNLGPPSYIQTAAETRVGDLFATCQKAVSYGCTMVELPSGYTNTTSVGMTPDQFDQINEGLVNNAEALGYA